MEALGPQSYATLQLIQVVGDRNVRIVPDVSVSGQPGGDGLVSALLGSMMRERTAGPATPPSK